MSRNLTLTVLFALVCTACNKGGSSAPQQTNTDPKHPDDAHATSSTETVTEPATGDAAARDDAAEKTAGSELRGTIYREGVPLDLAATPLEIYAEHCREESEPRVLVHADVERDMDPVLIVTGNWTTAKLGEKMTPPTDSKRHGAREVSVAVYASVTADRVAEYRLPQSAWVRFDQLAKGGPIAVELEADFGKFGTVAGRIEVATTTAEVCVVPAPPPPPPQ